ncbi:SLC13 family permease [Salinigranum sp. GCM10025319]|uniref:SLC13 family permease n=1 Tax=Salinigranum sp. GCM10025319 TaxID=3252687 RepID=UPI00360F0FD1
MRTVRSGIVGDARDTLGVLLICVTLLLLVLRYALGMDAGGILVVIVAVAVMFWMTNVLDPTLVGLFVIGSIWLTQSGERALVGFTYPATWLVVFGIVMGEAIQSSGLSDRLEHVLYDLVLPTDGVATPERVYRKLLVALCLVGAALAIVVPSAMVRVLLLAPIVSDIGARFSREKARIGVFTAPLVATYYSGTGVLTGSLPNVVVVDILRTSGGVEVSWLEWFLTMFPLMGLARALLVAAVVARLCRPAGTEFDAPDPSRTDSVDRSGRMTLLLFLGVGIWLTDAWHGLHPAFGAVVVVLLALLPPIGILSSGALADVDVSIALFVAAVFAIADGLTATGVAGQAAQTLLGTVPQPTSLAGGLVLAFGFTLVSMLFVEGVAVASILTPVLLESVPALDATAVVMAEAVALGTYFFPYQSGVLIAILGEGVVDTKQLVLIVSACSIASTVLLVPLQFAVLVLLS